MDDLLKSAKAGAGFILASLWTIGCGWGGPAGPIVHEHHVIERGGAMTARVEIGMSGGELNVKSGSTPLFAGDFDYNVAVLKPAIAYAVDGTTGTLKVTQGSTSGEYENTWRVSLDEKTPVDLQLTLNAGDAELVLGRLNLRSLSIRLGAGDLVLDLRGTPANSYTVNVLAGAGDATIRLPATVGVSVQTTGPLGDVTVNGLEQRDGRWINPRAATSKVMIDLQVKHAIGDLRLSAE